MSRKRASSKDKNKWQRLVVGHWQRLMTPLQRLRRDWLQRHPQLRRARKAVVVTGLTRALAPVSHGRAPNGQSMLEGVWPFHGRPVELRNEAFWVGDGTAEWRRWQQSFEWLADLAAVGGGSVRMFARQIVQGWLIAHGRADGWVGWDESSLARRLRAWLTHPDLLLTATQATSIADALDERILTSAVVQARYLRARYPYIHDPMTRFRAALALWSAAVCLGSDMAGDGAHSQDWALAEMERSLDALQDSAGASHDRNPSTLLALLELLLALRRDMEHQKTDAPDWLVVGIERAAMALRCLRLGDGGLMLLHGGNEEGSNGRLDTALAAAGGNRMVPDRDLGVVRLSAGRTVVLMDVGRVPSGIAAASGHASVLGLEFSVGRRRVVTACGGGQHLDAEWRMAMRGPAAHSTLNLNGEIPCQRWTESGRVLFEGPHDVVSDRRQGRQGLLALGIHDGYQAELGFTHMRRLFLSIEGDDLRGEDTLEVEPEDEAIFHAAVAKRRAIGGLQFCLRFHLHPDVNAAILPDGTGVALTLGSGDHWIMRQSGGELSLDESIWLGRGDQPRPCKQIVILGKLVLPRCLIRWAFRRADRSAQVTRDVEAVEAMLKDDQLVIDQS